MTVCIFTYMDKDYFLRTDLSNWSKLSNWIVCRQPDLRGCFCQCNCMHVACLLQLNVLLSAYSPLYLAEWLIVCMQLFVQLRIV